MNASELKITKPNGHIKTPQNINARYNEADKPKLAKASKDFETMLTTMMIKSMTKTTDGLFGKENYGGDVLDVVFESQMASFITESKGIGVADAIYKNLTGEVLPKSIKQNNSFSNDMMKDAVFSKGLVSREKMNKIPANSKLEKSPKITPSHKSLERVGKYEKIIHEAANKFDVDKNLIKSVILTESAGNEKAHSSAKAKGLMQLMDSTATDMGVKNVWDPKQNIFGGTKYLSKMIRQYDGDIKLALAAYNAGPGNVEKYNGVPPFKETEKYIEKVNAYLRKLGQ